MIDVQKAHFWIFFVNSEKTKILDQNIFLHKFWFTKGLPIILKYVLALCMVFVTPYRLFQYLHPKGIKFVFFSSKFFKVLQKFLHKNVPCGCRYSKIFTYPKVCLILHTLHSDRDKKFIKKQSMRVRKNNEKLVWDRTKIFTRYFQYKKAHF